MTLGHDIHANIADALGNLDGRTAVALNDLPSKQRKSSSPELVQLKGRKAILFANTDWYLFNFRMSLLRRLRDEGVELLLISPPGPYGAKLQALGFRWRALDMQRRSLGPLREAKLLIGLIALLRREKPDVIHGFTIKCAVYGGLSGRLAQVAGRIAAINGLGYVFTSRDARALALRPIVGLLMRVACGGKTARVVVQNPDDRSAVLAAGLAPENIRLIAGSGVDLRRFCPKIRLRPPGGAFRVLMPARLLWDKGIGEFVEAARRLKNRGLEFLIAGDADPGNPASVPKKTIEDWRREEVVTFLGHVSDMAGLFGEIDVVVLPSYREGLPKALIEAAACALPLVTVDVPGCRDVVTDGIDGLIVPVKDPSGLVDAIMRLESDPELAKRLGAAAREKAVRYFDDQIVVARTIAVYRELAGG